MWVIKTVLILLASSIFATLAVFFGILAEIEEIGGELWEMRRTSKTE